VDDRKRIKSILKNYYDTESKENYTKEFQCAKSKCNERVSDFITVSGKNKKGSPNSLHFCSIKHVVERLFEMKESTWKSFVMSL
jgi:hypothetical protein